MDLIADEEAALEPCRRRYCSTSTLRRKDAAVYSLIRILTENPNQNQILLPGLCQQSRNLTLGTLEKPVVRTLDLVLWILWIFWIFWISSRSQGDARVIKRLLYLDCCCCLENTQTAAAPFGPLLQCYALHKGLGLVSNSNWTDSGFLQNSKNIK